MSDLRLKKILSAVIGLGLVALGVWATLAGHAGLGAAIVAGGLGTLGLPPVLQRRGPADELLERRAERLRGTVDDPDATPIAPRRRRPTNYNGSGDGGGLGLLLFAIAISVAHASGCGASAFATHVEVAAGFEDSARETGHLVRTYRTDRMRLAARAVHEAGGSEEQAIAAAQAAAVEVEGLVEAQRVYASATHTYVDALWLSQQRGLDVAGVIAVARDVLDAYRHLRRLGGAAGLAELAALPETPTFLDGALAPQLLAGASDGGTR